MYTSRMKSLREEKSKNQIDIAKILSCTQACYSKWELQSRDTPTKVLCALADYYNVSTDYLLGRTDERKPYPPSKE